MDYTGTSGNDIFQVSVNIQQLTTTLINPYSGQIIEIDEEKNVNFDKFYGQGNGNDFDRVELTTMGDAIFLEDINTGEQTLFDIEFIQGKAGGDIIIVASDTYDYEQGIVINGGTDDDILWGNIGDDNINGVDGDDNIDGGPGDDILIGFRDNDLLFGGDGADSIYGDTTFATLNVVGDDTVFGGGGDDLILGGYGDDTLNGETGNDEIDGEFGNDMVSGGAGNDVISGGDGNDILFGGTGGDDSSFIDVTEVEHVFNETLTFPELIERKKIADLAPPGTANLGVVDGNLSVAEPTTAKITFLKSGAGYHNTLGFYNIAEDGTIQHTEIAFSNVHRSVAQPGLEHSVTLPGAPDSDFGFFIISDGFRKEGQYNGLDLNNPENLSFFYKFGTADQRLAKVTDDASDIDLVYDDGSQTEILDGRGVYHTHERGGAGINLNPDNAEHVVSGLAAEDDTSTLRIGFEDLKNLGDADFNDVVFDLEIEGQTNVETLVEDNDTINGGAGEDVLWGGYGDDTLTGGADSDIFLFTAIDHSIDTITDFEVGANGDELNLTDLLTEYNENDDAIADFLEITSSGSDSVVSVDKDGGGDSFIDIAVIEGGVGNATLQDLLDDGNLVIDQSAFI